MDKTKYAICALTAAAVFAPPGLAMASDAISGGVWASWRYNNTDDSAAAERDSETGGDIGREAIILYMDDTFEDTPWSYSGEIRFGPGSFTEPSNNSTGDNFALHKAWVGYQLNESSDLKIGKSAVPFGWKTVNFWPGDGLLGGYGDQMDVGVKYTGGSGDFGFSAAYFHQDDWGENSTDTMDDNAHWGSSTTYSKGRTVVGDLNYTVGGDDTSHKFGGSVQVGKLYDQANSCSANNCDALDDGSHDAGVVYYEGEFGPAVAKAQYIMVNRDVPNQQNDVENSRIGLTGGYTFGDLFAYLEFQQASTDTEGNDADDIQAFTPGVRYDYGPGWIYLEYLDQDGFIGRDGDVTEGDFSSFYATIDYYF